MTGSPASSGRKDAARYGFSPQASAAENVAAIQAALDGGGHVVVDTPGVYDLDDTVLLDSDTTLTCAPGVVFRKVAPYCNVLLNRGALTRQFNENITVDGLELRVNGQEGPPKLVYGLRAQIGFHRVRGLTLRNFTCIDGKPYQYLVYIVNWSDLRIENVRLAGDKDGIKLNYGHDAVIRDLDLTTYDDGLSVCGTDYPSTLVEVGDVYNVRYINVTDHQYKNIFGRTCLIYTGSWAAWRKGNAYDTGDFCLSEGKLYQVVADGGFSAVASMAPTHGSGVATGEDGLPWRYVQDCEVDRTNVYNVSFDNCTFEKSGNIVASWIVPDWMWAEAKGVHRPFYPGTEAASGAWGISVNNCRVVGKGPQVLVNLMGNMRDVSITGCLFDNPRSTAINVDKDSVNDELMATLTGCTFMGADGPMAADHGDKSALPDHQHCPILRQDMDDTGKLMAVHNGGTLRCAASGNSYRGPGVACNVTGGSALRFSTMDMPLQTLDNLTPAVGDTCRTTDGLYVYTSGGWSSLSS